ncbi:hypothetical protein GE061_006458 [Apolygus lucorum]|uniref:Uncharacterized protein n=1 Tax=Apolygus lucorum TaxID=248454 RepID=A0A6A4IYZ6_APOLU|nr:hypothetical protein GE061_006458 [Apolygus lucorum]
MFNLVTILLISFVISVSNSEEPTVPDEPLKIADAVLMRLSVPTDSANDSVNDSVKEAESKVELKGSRDLLNYTVIPLMKMLGVKTDDDSSSSNQATVSRTDGLNLNQAGYQLYGAQNLNQGTNLGNMNPQNYYPGILESAYPYGLQLINPVASPSNAYQPLLRNAGQDALRTYSALLPNRGYDVSMGSSPFGLPSTNPENTPRSSYRPPHETVKFGSYIPGSSPRGFPSSNPVASPSRDFQTLLKMELAPFGIPKSSSPYGYQSSNLVASPSRDFQTPLNMELAPFGIPKSYSSYGYQSSNPVASPSNGYRPLFNNLKQNELPASSENDVPKSSSSGPPPSNPISPLGNFIRLLFVPFGLPKSQPLNPAVGDATQRVPAAYNQNPLSFTSKDTTERFNNLENPDQSELLMNNNRREFPTQGLANNPGYYPSDRASGFTPFIRNARRYYEKPFQLKRERLFTQNVTAESDSNFKPLKKHHLTAKDISILKSLQNYYHQHALTPNGFDPELKARLNNPQDLGYPTNFPYQGDTENLESPTDARVAVVPHEEDGLSQKTQVSIGIGAMLVALTVAIQDLKKELLELHPFEHPFKAIKLIVGRTIELILNLISKTVQIPEKLIEKLISIIKNLFQGTNEKKARGLFTVHPKSQ